MVSHLVLAGGMAFLAVVALLGRAGGVLVGWELLRIGALGLFWSFLVDRTSLVFFIVVIMIYIGVLGFSFSYMHSDYDRNFYFTLLGFVLSMGVLIFTPHLFFLMVG